MVTEIAPAPQPAMTEALEGGSYEILRRRLEEAADRLVERAELLNAQRADTFGGSELAVVGSERIRTEHNCLPRDMITLGDVLLVGYNVFLGLKSEIRVEDVFGLFRRVPSAGGVGLEAAPASSIPGLVDDPRFVKEHAELHRFYEGSRLVRLCVREGRLLALFQTGQTLSDLRGFRWGLRPGGGVEYIDNRAEEDYRLPPPHRFEWVRTTREDQVRGRHPHVNVLDTVFVETVGGDLTVKIENNTEDGLGIYREPVDDPRQTLDDAEFRYARVAGLILLDILPYQEKARRYLVYNPRTQEVRRIDAIGLACLELPENHGIVFPGGYYLQSGEMKIFDNEIEDLVHERTVAAPNGEDVLYAFYHRETGRYLLLPYNIIRKEVQTPLDCRGFAFFDDGALLAFRGPGTEPTRVHPLQIWRTPFVSDEHALAAPIGESFLEKVGNAELVRGISEAFSLSRLARARDPTRQTFEDLVAGCTRALDAYHWIDHPEALELGAPLRAVREATERVVDEFEKVVALRARAAKALEEAGSEQARLLEDVRPADWREIRDFLEGMTALRKQRGHLITLRDIRFMDRPALDALEEEVVKAFERVSEGCVRFLLNGEALGPVAAAIDQVLARAQRAEKATDLAPLETEAQTLGTGLDLLSEAVASLEVEDPTDRTRILEEISEVYSRLNRCRATLEKKKRALQSQEGRAEFAAQFRLLTQSVESAVALATTPEACDEQQSRLLVQLEELEGRFAELDEFLADLATKREEITDAFSAKKQQLLDERQRRAQNLAKAAERIVEAAERRARTFADEDALNAYFASDPMLLKLEKLAKDLNELGDTLKADDVAARLKTAKQTALRNLRDKRDLFEVGGDVIKLGRHRFFVNTQPFDLALLPRDDGMALHLTGTDYWEPVEDPELLALRDHWSQELVSESAEVYRGEYLAASLLEAAERGDEGLELDQLLALAHGEGALLEVVRRFASGRYEEGYERGVHDADAAAILEKLLVLRSSAGALRFGAAARSAALLYWAFGEDPGERGRVERRAQSLGRLRAAFGQSPAEHELAEEISDRIRRFLEDQTLPIDDGDLGLAGIYLVEELREPRPHFVESSDAETLRRALTEHLEMEGQRRTFEEDLRTFEDDPGRAVRIARAWLEAFLQAGRGPEGLAQLRRGGPRGLEHRPTATGGRRTSGRGTELEAAASLVLGRRLDRTTSSALTHARVEGLLGAHPRIMEGVLDLRIDEMLPRLTRFSAERVPAFRRLREVRHRILEEARWRLRLDELAPRVLSSFVRNQLIDQVYLPLIGDNLAKQLGAAGEAKRTDLMGLLLVVSPPGYGKTTLMEYVASRLGMVFMKVNGPALGHEVKSLDPAEAPNATARQEVEKINLAFEMASNVMLYLDDIQHTHPELLQKFISLCDGQRRVEGVWRGRTRTYDLRGQKFCVVMAGNPYTESGEKFQIPDMLANRADTYNLGDILDGREDVFALSYLENCLTSSPVLGPMAARSLADMRRLIDRARGREVPDADFEQDWSQVEIEAAIQTFRRLMKVQGVLLRVNLQYIASASQDDRFRTEPPFKLQGSYRNMNKLAEKVAPAMNDEELEALITDHYASEAQTLTSGAEANLLKLAELRGRLTEPEAARWNEIKREFRRLQVVGGGDEDPAARATSALAAVAGHLDGIRAAVESAAVPTAKNGEHLRAEALLSSLARLEEALGRLAEPNLSVSLRSEPALNLDAALAAPLAAIERTLGPLAQAATESHNAATSLFPALTELVELLRMQVLTGPLVPGLPIEPPGDGRPEPR